MNEMKEVAPKLETRGKADEREKASAVAHFHQSLFDHIDSLPDWQKEKLKESEIKKTEEQEQIIDFVNEETNKLMVEMDESPYNIPAENYHIIKTKLYNEIAGKEDQSLARALTEPQGIIFKQEGFKDRLLTFAVIAFHETLHLKARTKIEVDGNSYKIYRQGVSINTLAKDLEKTGEHEHFKGLHEAIVAQLEHNFVKRAIEHPLFKEEKKWLESQEVKQIKGKFAKERGINIDKIYWVSRNGVNFDAIFYDKHIEFLKYLCEEIKEELPDRYKNTEEVFKEFQKAHFNGEILNVARIITKTFGKNSFRILGNMDGGRESSILHFQTFKSLRKNEKSVTDKKENSNT